MRVNLWSLVTMLMSQISRLVLWGNITASRLLSEWSWRLRTPPVAAMNLVSLITSCFDLSEEVKRGSRTRVGRAYLALLAR